MKLVDYLNSVDIDTIAQIEKRFSFGISPVTRNKLLSKIGTAFDFYSKILESYDNENVKSLINIFFEGHSCGIEYNIEDSVYSFLLTDLWGYISENSHQCRFVFFSDATIFIKNHIDSLISSSSQDLDYRKSQINIFSFLDSFILMLGSGKFKALRSGVTKAIINNITEKTGYENRYFIKFAYYLLFDQGIIKEDTNSHIVTDINMAQTWHKIDNFTKVETVINYMCSKYIASLFNKRDSICISLASYMFSPDSPSTFSVDKTARFLVDIMRIPEKSVDDFLNILENSEFIIKDGGQFVKKDIYKFFSNQEDDKEKTHDDLFYVQPNFEIIISFMCEPDVSLYLSRFAELISHDRAVIFRITKNSFTRAISSGMKADDVIIFIKEKSRNPVPENVVFNLKEWEKEVVSIIVENVNIIRFDDDFLRDKIIALEDMKNQMISKISHNCYAVKDIDAVNEILFKNGYYSDSSTKIHNDSASLFSKETKLREGAGFSDSQETILPKFVKRFEKSQRLYALSQEEKIKAFKYALVKDLKVEFIYSCPQDKQLHNKKHSSQVFEVSNSWKNPDVYIYIENLKRNYNINISDVKRMRVVI